MALIQQNLVPGTGDHLITLDTDTNLEWLSLNATANLSYLDVLGGAGGYTTSYGFRYATIPELMALWNHAGITRIGGPDMTDPNGNSAGIDKLIKLIGGATTYPDTNTIQTQGIITALPAPGHPALGRLWFFIKNPADSYADTDILPTTPPGGTPENTRNPEVASYLVRDHAFFAPPAPPSNLRVG